MNITYTNIPRAVLAANLARIERFVDEQWQPGAPKHCDIPIRISGGSRFARLIVEHSPEGMVVKPEGKIAMSYLLQHVCWRERQEEKKELSAKAIDTVA